ncbi:MAG: S1 RNA-binding domain-containing protein [Chloroflexota bacterium]|nr:S1 RNA-binding domain-containing protein [Chloroflexota bacterium]MDE2947226.1 S1 RNA-binding domain-containing protein [Chloroflexota bacterium]
MAVEAQALTVGAEVKGIVRHIGVYGALVDIGTGQDALLHVSQLAQQESSRLEEFAQPGSEILAYVYKTRQDGYVALSLERPPLVAWGTIRQGKVYTGQVIRVEDFGVFVDFGAERPGMVHVSEMSDNYVRTPSDVAEVGQQVEVRVIKKNGRSRQIDLTMKLAPEEVVVSADEEDEEAVPTSMAQAFRRAMQGAADEDAASAPQDIAQSNHRQKQEEILARTLRNAGA